MKLKYCLVMMLTFCAMLAGRAVWAEEEQIDTEVAVETAKIIKTSLHRYVMAYGLVEPQPVTHLKSAASSRISVPVTAILAQVYCEEGGHVNKGEVLFELDSRSSEALIAKAEVAAAFAEKNFARKQQLSAGDNISRKLYDEAEQLVQTARRDLLNARVQRELLQIKAPFSGTVTAIHYKVGEAVNPGMVLAELVDLERLDIAVHIPSPEAAELHLGQPVTIMPDVKSGIVATSATSGQVTFIGSQIDPLTDTVLLRASLNADSGLRLGQFLRVRIQVGERLERLAVPLESLVSKAGVAMIAVVEADSATLQTVTPGWRDGNLVEVAGENLREGLTIVSRGAYGLPQHTRIRSGK